MKENKVFKYVFTATFVLLAILMIASTKIKSRIDATVIIVLLIAYLPWLSKYIKSLEAFGAKIELLSDEKKEKLQENVNKLEKNSSKNIKPVTKNTKTKANNQSTTRKEPLEIEVALEEAYSDETRDPIEKILLMRYELRNRLKEICIKNNIDDEGRSVTGLAYVLNEKNLIMKDALDLIVEIAPLMNRIINSDINAISNEDINWVMETGRILIGYLKAVLI